MPSIDMPLEQMRQYKPSLYREADFEQFWETTVNEAVSQPLNAELIPYVLPVKGLQCYAVRFDGYRGGRIAGWYVRPTSRGKFPGVCMYHGYSGRGPRPMDMIAYAAQGMCVLSMDCRGQNGQSQDVAVVDEGFQMGWMTKGIRDPKQYYFRYVYADAVRALELLGRREEVDDKRIAVTGGSQGGALSLAAAALSEAADPVSARCAVPLRFPPGNSDHAQWSVSGDHQLPQSVPGPLRHRDPHAELRGQHEPGIADSLPDNCEQRVVGRHLSA